MGARRGGEGHRGCVSANAVTKKTRGALGASCFAMQLLRQESVTFPRDHMGLLVLWTAVLFQADQCFTGPQRPRNLSERSAGSAESSLSWLRGRHRPARKSCSGTRSAGADGGGCVGVTRGVSPILSARGRKLWNPHCVSPCSLCNSTGRNRLLFRGTIGFC